MWAGAGEGGECSQEQSLSRWRKFSLDQPCCLHHGREMEGSVAIWTRQKKKKCSCVCSVRPSHFQEFLCNEVYCKTVCKEGENRNSPNLHQGGMCAPLPPFFHQHPSSSFPPGSQPEWFVKIPVRAGISPTPAASYFSQDKSQAPTMAPPAGPQLASPPSFQKCSFSTSSQTAGSSVQPHDLCPGSSLCLEYSSPGSSRAIPILRLLVAV